MEQKIFDFCEERFCYELPKVQFSTERLDLTARTGAEATGSFGLSTEKKGERVRGYFTCEDHRVGIKPLTVDGEKAEIRIFYDTTYLLSGEKKIGSIFFISDHGEYEIPYSIEIQRKSLFTKEKNINTLEEFVELAKENYGEAVRLFFDKDFDEVILEGRKKEALVRKGLLYSSDKAQALEEFLCFLKVKERVKPEFEKSKYEFHVIEKPMQYKFKIKKNTWGYCRLKLSVEGGFIRLNKTEITEKDFWGEECILDLMIDPEGMYGGKSLSKLLIQGNMEEKEIEISLINVGERKRGLGGNRKRLALAEEAIKAYYSYRMGIFSLKEMEKNVRTALYEEKGEKKREESAYIGAYLDFLNGDKEAVKKILEENARWEKTPLAGMMHTYLEFLLAEEDKSKFRQKMEEFAESYGVMEAYFCILKMEERFKKSRFHQLELLTKLYKAGMNRSFLYLETWLLYVEEPELLTKLDGLTVRAFSRALRFGYPLKDELVLKFAHLAGSLRDYHPIVIGILKSLYEIGKKEEVLSAIASLLLKAEKNYSDTGKWLKLGVRKGIKVTGIYELYLDTLGKEEEIEPSALAYFQYGNSLNCERQAFLYSYLVKHREDSEIREFFEGYRVQIRKFAEEELKKGVMSENHSIIYRLEMKDSDFLASMGEHLSKLMYKAEVTVREGRFPWIVLVNENLKKPIRYPAERKAYPDYMLSSSVLFFSDAEDRLFLVDASEIKVLFDHEFYLDRAMRAGDKSIFTYLEAIKNRRTADGKQVADLIYELSESKDIEEGLRIDLRKRLLAIYEEKHDFIRMEEVLKAVDFKVLRKEDRLWIARFVIRNPIKAYRKQAVRCVGIENLEKRDLENFVRESLAEGVEKEEEGLLLEAGLCLLRKGLGEDNLYAWMIERLEAPVRVFLLLFQKLAGNDLLSVHFTEKIMEQSLFTEVVPKEADEVYLYYDRAMNKILERAFLNYRFYSWLLKDVSMGSFVQKKLVEEAYRTRSYLPAMAYLKLLSKKDVLTSEEKEFAVVRLLKFVEEGVALPFFKDFIGKCDVPAELENISFVSYRGNVGDEISINYRILQEEADDGSYVNEWMKNVYMGIFVKEFLIFADERIRYYISDYADGEERVLTSGEIAIEAEDLLEEDGNKSLYAQINHVVLAKKLEDGSAVREYMKNYRIQKEIVEEIFAFPAPDEGSKVE